MPNTRHGSSFDSFLREENLLEEVEAAALKKVSAYPGWELRLAGVTSKKTQPYHPLFSRFKNRLSLRK
jgi:hypothetical protein